MLAGAGAFLLLGTALPGRPAESLHIQRKQGAELHLLMPLGRSFVYRYIHSVERTPVEDIYYAMGGRLHEWRTRTRSHNAGLPWQAPQQGRFLSEGPWLVLEGGRNSWEELRVRVGDEYFGRNELLIEAYPRMELYKKFPGESLRLFSCRESLLERYTHTEPTS